jgi:thiol-disulfide isomerase/thioredoxin
MNTKTYILITTIFVIILIIYFINLKTPDRNTSSNVETITPRISPETKEVETATSKITPETKKLEPKEMKKDKSKEYPLAKEITTPDGFINTDGKPITIKELIGKKVILVDFWTYSCINCQRTTPYLNAWHEKYKDQGLVIIGIHTPEFEFEKNYNNVKAAVEKFGIKFPVVLDNDYSTWTAYKNRYWPRKYLIDIDGYIIYDHIGEGAYEETEKKIQEALSERMAILGKEENLNINQPLTPEAKLLKGLTLGSSISPETYFGASRNEFLGNGTPGTTGSQNFMIPSSLEISTLYLSGNWDISNESAQNISPNAKILYQHKSKDVFLVAEAENEILVEVLRNGKPLGAEAGADIIKTPEGKTVLKIKAARLYKIIQGQKLEEAKLEFIITQPGLKAFAFTFG